MPFSQPIEFFERKKSYTRQQMLLRRPSKAELIYILMKMNWIDVTFTHRLLLDKISTNSSSLSFSIWSPAPSIFKALMDSILTISCLLLFVVSLLYCNPKKRRNTPPGPRGIIGIVLNLSRKQPWKTFARWGEQYGTPFRIWMTPSYLISPKEILCTSRHSELPC